MKNKIILILALVGVLIGCKEDEYDAPNTFSDVGFYTSAGQSTVLQLNIFDYMTFSDLSQGYTSHYWKIEEGNNFLEGPMQSRDSVFTDKIIYPGTTITTDETIHVFFNNSGYQEVTLHDEFNEYVEFRGYNKDTKTSYIKPAVKQGDVWVIDTTFVVKVFDTIIPEIEVKQFGETIDHTTTDTVYVEAGDVVQFIDNTTIGEPTGRYWFARKTLEEGAVEDPSDVVASSGAQTADLVFKKLGHFTTGVTVNRTGQNIPGDSEKYIIPRPFKVIPSSKPFELAGVIRELEDETIQIPFNGEFAPFIDKEAFFKVTVNGVEFPIQSLTINEDDSTILNIVLSDPIYRPDEILISLLDGSGIESTDTRTPVAFTDAPVVMHDVNLLPAEVAGFEDGGTRWGPFTPAWGANQGGIEFTTERAFKGNYSMKLTSEAGQRCAVTSFLNEDSINFEAGVVYTLRVSLYVESSTVAPNSISWWLLQDWKQFWIAPNQPQGEWITLETDYTSSGSLSQLYFRILPNGASDMVAYFDDFYIVKKEVRP